MKATSRLMFLILLATASTGFSWSGGPWSGNTADNSSGQGFYSGTFRGSNLLGVFGLSYNSSGSAANANYFAMHEGFSTSGTVAGIVDTSSRTVAGVMTSATAQNTNNTGNSSGAFSAKITSTKPQIKFSGKGEFASDANATVTVPSSTSDPSNTVTSSTRTRTTTKMTVSGTRTSIAFPSAGSTTTTN